MLYKIILFIFFFLLLTGEDLIQIIKIEFQRIDDEEERMESKLKRIKTRRYE